MEDRRSTQAKPLIRAFRIAQTIGDFRTLGQIINAAQSANERGMLLGMLACEIAIRKSDLKTAKHVMQMARSLLVDEYENLVIAKKQSKYIEQFARDRKFAQAIIQKRIECLEQGLF